MNCINYCASPLARITLSSDGNTLTGLWLKEQKYYGGQLAKNMDMKKLLIHFLLNLLLNILHPYFQFLTQYEPLHRLPISHYKK